MDDKKTNLDMIIKEAKWRGFVDTTLHAINDDLKELKSEQKKMIKEMVVLNLLASTVDEIQGCQDKLKKQINKLFVKLASISGTVALIVTIVIMILKSIIFEGK